MRDDARYAMAQQLLANTSMNIAEIAASLGYAEASAFVRAFTRWAGTTPGSGAPERPERRASLLRGKQARRRSRHGHAAPIASHAPLFSERNSASMTRMLAMASSIP